MNEEEIFQIAVDMPAAERGTRAARGATLFERYECTSCHGGARGELLGAFSYLLWRGER